MFIHCHVVVIYGARMQIVSTVVLIYGQHSIISIQHLIKLPEAKQHAKGKGKSFMVLKNAVDDSLIQAKMKFLELLSFKLNELLRGFQTDQSMVPF